MRFGAEMGPNSEWLLGWTNWTDRGRPPGEHSHFAACSTARPPPLYPVGFIVDHERYICRAFYFRYDGCDSFVTNRSLQLLQAPASPSVGLPVAERASEISRMHTALPL